MRMVAGFGFVLCFTAGLWAQGSVVHPAGGGLSGVTTSLGSVVNPASGGLRAPSNGYRYGYGNGGRANRNAIYAYPVYIGGYYASPYISTGDDYSAVPPAAPSNTTVVVAPQQPVTPVVINYNYGSAVPVPLPPDRTAAPAQGQDDDTAAAEPAHYLIAFKDHTIYAATAYWVDGDTIHYFTDGNVHNQASLSLVDRDFTERLNKEAGVEVKLPPAPSKQQ